MIEVTAQMFADVESFITRVHDGRPMESDADKLLHSVFLAGYAHGVSSFQLRNEETAIEFRGSAQYRMAAYLRPLFVKYPMPVEKAENTTDDGDHTEDPNFCSCYYTDLANQVPTRIRDPHCNIHGEFPLVEPL